VLAALSALGAGCAAAPRPSPPLEAGEQPWLLPPSAWGTQRLFRCSYRGPDGEGGFKATLRLATPARFEVLIVDTFGRQLAVLHVDGEGALLVDLRRRTHCSNLESLRLPGIGALPLLPSELPAVLLGALPAAPPSALPGAAAFDQDLEFTDARGRRWWARLEGDRVEQWRVREEGEPSWSWARGRGVSATLSGAAGAELRWQQVVAEPLRTAPAAASPPAGSVESCAPLPGV
jgi:hypothetical protein